MKRSNRPEMLDGTDVPEKELHASLAFMAVVNRFFGGWSAIRSFFAAQDLQAAFRVLDLGTGGGDLPYALSRWAEKRGKRAEILAIDINPATIAYAQSKYRRPGLEYRVASAFDLESLGQFDFIVSSMFFHHLTDEEIVRLLALVDRHARRGFIVNDLYRSVPAWTGTALFSALWMRKIIFNDATVSVERGFVREDFRRYRELAAVPAARIRRRPLFRLTMARHA